MQQQTYTQSYVPPQQPPQGRMDLLRKWIIPAMLIASMTLNIILAVWIVHSITNFSQYCYWTGTETFTGTGTSNFTEQAHTTCSDNPLPQTP